MALLNMATNTFPSTPSSGTMFLFPHSFDKSIYTVDDGGVLNRLDSFLYASAGATTVTAAATTIIGGGTGTTAKIPANGVKAGTSFRVTILGSFTGTATATAFRVHYGTAGTSADTVVFTASVTGAVGTSVAKCIINMTVRTIGASATAMGFLDIQQHAAAVVGVANSAGGQSVVQGTMASFNTTVDSYLTVSILSAASGSSGTLQQVMIERL